MVVLVDLISRFLQTQLATCHSTTDKTISLDVPTPVVALSLLYKSMLSAVTDKPLYLD
jgi:hypothetical protein